MEPALRTALIRSAINGFFTAGMVFFGAWQAALQTNATDEQALVTAAIAAGSAFFGIMVTRGGGEGTIDSARDARQDASTTLSKAVSQFSASGPNSVLRGFSSAGDRGGYAESPNEPILPGYNSPPERRSMGPG